MILQALYNYYDRLNELQDDFLAPIGFEDREIGFVIVVLIPNGKPLML
jgi:hypothetical protein